MHIKHDKKKCNLKNIKDNVYIIAEIGVNHNCDIKIAKKQIDLAKKGGASAVSFKLTKLI